MENPVSVSAQRCKEMLRYGCLPWLARILFQKPISASYMVVDVLNGWTRFETGDAFRDALRAANASEEVRRVARRANTLNRHPRRDAVIGIVIFAALLFLAVGRGRMGHKNWNDIHDKKGGPVGSLIVDNGPVGEQPPVSPVGSDDEAHRVPKFAVLPSRLDLTDSSIFSRLGTVRVESSEGRIRFVTRMGPRAGWLRVDHEEGVTPDTLTFITEPAGLGVGKPAPKSTSLRSALPRFPARCPTRSWLRA